MAPLITDGITITHSALSKRSCGMSSGILRISFITIPEFRKRDWSFALSSASALWGLKSADIPMSASTLSPGDVLFIVFLLVEKRLSSPHAQPWFGFYWVRPG